MQILYENPIHLIADENMILTDGETYTTEAWLAKIDSPSNWHEVSIEEVPPENEQLFRENNISFSI